MPRRGAPAHNHRGFAAPDGSGRSIPPRIRGPTPTTAQPSVDRRPPPPNVRGHERSRREVGAAMAAGPSPTTVQRAWARKVQAWVGTGTAAWQGLDGGGRREPSSRAGQARVRRTGSGVRVPGWWCRLGVGPLGKAAHGPGAAVLGLRICSTHQPRSTHSASARQGRGAGADDGLVSDGGPPRRVGEQPDRGRNKRRSGAG